MDGKGNSKKIMEGKRVFERNLGIFYFKNKNY